MLTPCLSPTSAYLRLWWTVPAQGKPQDLVFQTRPLPQQIAAQTLSAGLCFPRCLETERVRAQPLLEQRTPPGKRAQAQRARGSETPARGVWSV